MFRHVQADLFDSSGGPEGHDFFYYGRSANELFQDPLYVDVLNSETFARLSEIRFLGAIDYVLFADNLPKSRRHTRLDHSIGVGQLALLYSQVAGLPHEVERILVLAALLHDVGHGPLSHSLEPAFAEAFGLEHHSVTDRIVRGKIPLGASLSKILRRHHIDAAELATVISGAGSRRESLLINGPINLDTVEGISRCYAYVHEDLSSGVPRRIVKALANLSATDIAVLDEFWRMKDLVYSHFIQSDVGLIADYICRNYLELHKPEFLGGSLFFRTEQELRRHHPSLFEQLGDLRRAAQHGSPSIGPVEYRRREFFVDPAVVPHSIEELPLRYRQKKHPAVLKDRRQ
jgi:uncharacterized protein